MINKILVAVDLSTAVTTESVCKAANEMAVKFGATVELITIMADYGSPLVASFFPEDAQAQLKAEMRETLSILVSEYFTVDVETALLQSSKRANAILTTAEETKPDLLILGVRRKHSRDGQRLLGSTTIGVTGRATCSVMVIRTQDA